MQSPLSHLLNTQAHADKHTHTESEKKWIEKIQRLLSLFSTRKMGVKGLQELYLLPQVKNQFKLELFLTDVGHVVLYFHLFEAQQQKFQHP